MDIQGEVGTDVEAASYKVGVVLSQSVPPNGSVLLQVSDLVAQAEAAGYVSGGDVTSGQNQRHTITLVVSAPSDLVHGVAVQKVDGNDRVVPVLDLNLFSESNFTFIFSGGLETLVVFKPSFTIKTIVVIFNLNVVNFKFFKTVVVTFQNIVVTS
jgi:hypothetical protein